MRKPVLALSLCVVSLCAAASAPADAATYAFSFAGGGVSGAATLTYGLDPVAGDPAGAYAVTGATGTFSDANLVPGLANVAIVGFVPVKPASPQPDNKLAPKSFSFLNVGNGIPTPEGMAPGLTYDGLFYPAGSPQTASDYPFSGGFLDIYGLALALSNGDYVNFWSNGVDPTGLNYGVAVTDTKTVLDYVSGITTVNTPEPASLALLGTGLLGCLTARRRTARR